MDAFEMHDRLQYRFGQRSAINYVLVMDEQPKLYSFLPPLEFQNHIIRFLSFVPKDLLQISESLSFYELVQRNGLDDPYRFHVKYSVNLNEYLDFMPKNRPYLFFVDMKSTIIGDIIKQLTASHCALRFHYCFNGTKDDEIVLPNQVSGTGHFLRLLYEGQQELFKLMGVVSRYLAPEAAIGWSGFYDFPVFVPAQSNYRIANTITGNFDYSIHEETDTITEKEIISNTEAPKQAHAEPKSFIRQQQIVEQADKIDFFAETCFEEKLINPVHEIEPFLSTLILVLPFQNPDVKAFLHETTSSEIKEYLSDLDFEQTENYIHQGKAPKSAQALLFNSKLIGLKTQFLDDIAFLHSSFLTSPVVRLPAQGKTMYRALSFFRSEAAGRLTAPGNRGKVLKTIQSFGQQLRRRILSADLMEKLREENRQIVAISDLPIEWTDIDGVPFCFTHDICRLPETGLHGLMANFVSHEQWRYTIPPDILTKTLVVFGSDEAAFQRWYPGVRKVSEKNGVVIRECLTISALKAAVEECRPHLLIIDSHGGYDAATKSSVLYIGREKLTGDLVVELKIAAPLVFLSACSTAPTYGTIDTIANAFFEVGALAVTTTYLPISVDIGSILYIRLLNNLTTAAKSPMHQNWLAFISHLLRTSAVGAANRQYYLKHPDDKAASAEAQVKDYTYLLSFYERRKIYDSMLKGPGPKLANSLPEFLFYSILGRADLIKFECWEDEFRRKNEH
ncbi:CHAT domain-containing protein [Mucilaginibacter yixingensis]|uniref:CHAT domain-containing protein n=1 Tax=Mucilaginibacter yixingensis TaxID=1295612 RepID=A0A2T5JBR4_9SPHI|nr:CHAT domain-containing protein [Mucilaginibacter yixingensis]PTQ99196.1 CHAT domain-containing protein [Mucilaginibacter yixingensis]